jgi:hypothetical protein
MAIIICIQRGGNNTFKERIIKGWTGSEYTHAGILLDKRKEVSSWSKCGVDIRPHKKSDKFEYYKIEGIDEQEVKDFFVEYAQNGYNTGSIVTAHVLNVDLGTEGYTCAELVYIFLFQKGVTDYVINPEKVTPGILREILKTLSMFHTRKLS